MNRIFLFIFGAAAVSIAMMTAAFAQRVRPAQPPIATYGQQIEAPPRANPIPPAAYTIETADQKIAKLEEKVAALEDRLEQLQAQISRLPPVTKMLTVDHPRGGYGGNASGTIICDSAGFTDAYAFLNLHISFAKNTLGQSTGQISAVPSALGTMLPTWSGCHTAAGTPVHGVR